MIVGILGVGHLAAAMLAGLLRSGLDPSDIILSPRGRAPELSAMHGIPMVADNRDLVERADVIILAVRPADAPAAVDGLPWRQGQVLISVCAGVALSRLAVAPAQAVRAMPLTAAEINASPTACFPALAEARAVLERLGPVVVLASEADFEVATVSAAVYGWVQDLIRRTVVWSTGKGPEEQAMRQLVALTFVAAGQLIAEKAEPMEKLLGELVTPGGITELGLDVLATRGQTQAWLEACEAVLTRLTGKSLG